MHRKGRAPVGAPLAIVVMAVSALAGCSAQVGAKLGADRSAVVTVWAELPEAAAAKLDQLRGVEPGTVAPLFDAALARAGAAERGVKALEVSTPGPRSFRGRFEVPDLAALAASSGAPIELRSDAKGGSLAIRIDRKGAAALYALFPGVDPYLLESLSPPALDGSDLTRAEYREMLGALLGSKTLPAVDASAVELVVELPGAPDPRTAKGFVVEGGTAKVRLPLLDLLVLETPILLSVAWTR